MVAMCWNLYIWMLMESSLLNDYKELPTKVMENGNGINGKGSPDHSTRVVSILSNL